MSPTLVLETYDAVIMDGQKSRPLSEVEMQTLDMHHQPITQPDILDIYHTSSKMDIRANELAPPSLRELGVFTRTSLESLHLEHAYSSINSINEKARKERKKSFEVQQKRKNSVEALRDPVRDGQNDMITESEKSRKERKRSFNKQRSRSNTSSRQDSQTFELLLTECENAYNSLFIDTLGKGKERKKGLMMRHNSREGFNVLVGENYKNLQKSKNVTEIQKRRCSTGMQYKTVPIYNKDSSPYYSSTNSDLNNAQIPNNHHRRTSSSGSTGSVKKKELPPVILDENESDEEDSENEDDVPRRRYSTGMRPDLNKVRNVNLSDNNNGYNYNPLYKKYVNETKDLKNFEIQLPSIVQGEIR